MNTRADAFRYGLLVGLKHAGCTEKVAYEILDQLEEVKYDIRGFEKTAGGRLGTAWNALKGFARGAYGGKTKLPAGVPGTGRGYRAGQVKGKAVGGWVKEHPLLAAGGGMVGYDVGKRTLFGANASPDDIKEQVGSNNKLIEEQFMLERERNAQQMARLAELMQSTRSGVPSWYNPRLTMGS